MIKKTIDYVDYNGVKRSEDFYFNLNEAELTEMELSTKGGMSSMLEDIVAADNTQKIIDVFKKLILNAYGEKSDDGRRFIKSEELAVSFSQTEAYVKLFMELATDTKAAIDFVNGVMPANMEEIKEEDIKQLSVVEPKNE